MPTDTDQTDRSGVALCAFIITNDLSLIFREQATSDFGVDAQVEMKRDGRPTGRLVGLQIKTGPSHFPEPYEDGWLFRPEKKHIPYWLDHSLPIYVLLVNLVDRTVYWQEVSQQTLETGNRGGVFVRVPRSHVLDTARDAWETAADKFAATAAADYNDNLDRLAPSTAGCVRRLAEASPGDAALLCAHLARGRNAPELTVRTLLLSAPPWIVNHGGDGYAVLADFAHSHGVVGLAVDAVLLAAEADPSNKLRYTISAGLISMQVDRERARELLEAARTISIEFSARIEIGSLMLGHPPTSAVPISIPPDIAERLTAVDNDADVLGFLATQRERANDLNQAVDLAEKGLALEPESWLHLDCLARMLTRRSQSGLRQPADQQRGVDLAERAVDQLHKWSGSTDQALRTLLQALTLSGSYARILDRALPGADGRAEPHEASLPEVMSAAAGAARALERTELADSLVDRLPEGVDKRFALLQHNTSIAGADAIREWTEVADYLDETRPEQLVQAVMRLADLGVDQSGRLDLMVDTGMITSQFQAVVSATAAATSDLPTGLPALRILADTEPIAATKMIELLVDANQLDDAQTAADVAYSRFGEADRLVRRANLLIRLGRDGEASDAANDALGQSGLDSYHRRIAHRLLAGMAVSDAQTNEATASQAWRRAETHLTECTSVADGHQAETQDVWNLIYVQLRLGETERANATLAAHDPQIRSRQDAGLWAAAVEAQPANGAIFARMLDLAGRFDDDPQFSGALLAAVVSRTRDEGERPATPADARLELPDDVRSQAFTALASHVERHGEESPIRVLNAPTTEELIDKMTEFMRQTHLPLIDLVEMIRQVRIPLGMLSTMIRRPYSSVLAQRGLGYFIAGTSRDTEDEADENAALAARNADVVADVSALLVSSILGEFGYARGLFRTVLLPTASQRDIAAGRVDLEGRSASSGSVTYDEHTASLVALGPDIDAQLAALDRFSKIQATLSSTQTTTAPPSDTLGEVAMGGGEAWLAPIALAKERGIALWSDDVAQRNLARALGVAAFGTVTLQQIRAASLLEPDDLDDAAFNKIVAHRRDEVSRAIAERVADLAVDAQTIIEQARSEGWSDLTLAAATVGRPAWWAQSPTPWRDLQGIIAAAEADAAPVDAWQVTAMWGASALAIDDASRMALLIACVCLIDPQASAGVDRAVAMLRLGNETADRRSAHPPADYLLQAAAELSAAGVLDDAHSFITRVRARLNDSGDQSQTTD